METKKENGVCKLTQLQNELKAPRNQYNKFGNYYYRSCEDILEALKPLLLKYNASLTIDDEIVVVGNRYYVKATARLFIDNKEYVSVAYAREEETKKGMDPSQITGASSSYARKYALNGLFLIDDNKDSDASNTHNKAEQTTVETEETYDTYEDKKLNDIACSITNKSYRIEVASYNKVQLDEKTHKGKTYTVLTIEDEPQQKYYIFDTFFCDNIKKCIDEKKNIWLYLTEVKKEDKTFTNVIFAGSEEQHSKLKTFMPIPF